MAHAVADLHTALAHAEHALSVLEQETERDTAFEVHVLGLGFQVTYAREELYRAEQFTLRTLDQRSAREETPWALDISRADLLRMRVSDTQLSTSRFTSSERLGNGYC
jgi:hypothetical protein